MYRRTNHKNLHVRGYKEEGTTSTPFDMVVMNDLDRFHLVGDVIDRVPALGPRAAYTKQAIREKLLDHKEYIAAHGEDMPEIRNWKWGLPDEHSGDQRWFLRDGNARPLGAPSRWIAGSPAVCPYQRPGMHCQPGSSVKLRPVVRRRSPLAR